MLPVLQTVGLGVVWLAWWGSWGKNLLRNSFTAYTVRQKTAAAVSLVSWTLSFLTMFAWIWFLHPWIAIPLLILFTSCSLTIATWAKQRR